MVSLKAKKKLSKKSTKDRQKDKISKSSKKAKSPLKRSTLGFEVEFFILNKNGQIVNEAKHLLKKIEEKKRNPHSEIINECSENMIEVGSYPSVEAINTMEALLDNLKVLLYTAEEENLVICPLATYPGKSNPQIKREVLKYRVEEILFGKKKYKLAGRCAGFHCHYALPWGVFSYKKLTLKKLINSKNKQSLVNAYNFLIAADPALTTFMQSSPFYQGRYLAKDSRLLVWRGDRALNYPDGLYSDYPKFGALPKYEHTGTDLINLINLRYEEWHNILKGCGITEREMPKYHSILDTNWTPIRINAHSTLEQRGMDINHLLIMISVSVVIKSVLQAIQEDYIKVECSDIAISEPFKIEKKTIYVPPDTYVIDELQKLSAYEGLESEVIWYYCKRLISLVKILNGKKIEILLEPLEKMIKDKKTIADEIISEAKKLGYDNFKKVMPNEIAAEIALNHSKRLFKEIVLAQKFIE